MSSYRLKKINKNKVIAEHVSGLETISKSWNNPERIEIRKRKCAKYL